MRILFLGDIVGKSARDKIYSVVPEYIKNNNIDYTIINGENSASGFGITRKIANNLFDSGIDAITLGNHSFDNKDIFSFIQDEPRIIRPANYPIGTPGRGSSLLKSKDGKNILIINLLGRVFMHPTLDCPFEVLDRELSCMELAEFCDAIIVDFHAEATSEKQAMGHYADGRISLMVGTHTHVPTADERILPKGTAYQSDAGMCGVYDSILGMDKSEPINRFISKMNSQRYKPAIGKATLCGIIVTLDEKTCLAKEVKRIKI